MHRISIALIALLTVACTGLHAEAQNGAVSQGSEYRIGVVNIQDVFDAYKRQEDEYETLRKRKDELQQPLDKLSEDLNAAKAKYDEGKETMTQAELISLQDEIQSMLSEYELQFKRAQEEIDRAENRLIRDVFQDINKAVQEVGAKYNYHLVFEGRSDAAAAPGRTGGLLYFSTTLNMTQRVIEHLNSNYEKN